MSSRIRRWTLRTVTIFSALLAIAAVTLWLSLPALVRWQVRSVLVSAGYESPTFVVDSATLFGIEISNLRAGKNGALTVSSTRIDYSPIKAMTGRIDSLRLEHAGILIDLDATDSSEAKRHFDVWSDTNASGLPLWRIELADCSITLVREKDRYTIRADGWMWREQLDSDRARLSLNLRTAAPASASGWLEGDVRFAKHEFNASAGVSDVDLEKVLPFLPQDVTRQIDEVSGALKCIATVVYADGKAQTQASVELRDGHLASADWAIALDGAAANVKFENLNPLRAQAGQKIHVDRVKIGESNEISNLDVTFDVDRRGTQVPTSVPDAPLIAVPPSVRLQSISCNWAGGRVESDGAVHIYPDKQSISITLVATQVGLNEVLRLISSGKVSGQGSLSGRLPLQVDWPKVTIGDGRIASDAPGEINFGQQIGDLASSVAAKDPRLRGQRQQVMEALANFHYDQIVFEFARTDDGLSVVTHIAGRGKKGLTTPLDLTVRNVGLEEALNAYLRSSLGVSTVGER